MREPHPWIATGVALLALGSTSYSSYTSHESLRISRETQSVSLFDEFQSEYASIADRFPARYQEPNFHPPRGSDDYNRLQSYWIFAYAEWFATVRLGGGTHQLWNDYYKGLILNAIEVPSLKYVLIDMNQTYGTRRPGLQAFYRALQNIAREAGEPLVEIPGTNAPAPHRQ